MADDKAPQTGWDEAVGYELAAVEYVRAVDADDLDALEALWRRAETDPALEQLFCDLNEGLLSEGGPPPQWQQYRHKVVELVGEHLRSGAESDPRPAGLTVGDVAARIAGDRVVLGRLRPADRDANAALVSDRTPLPNHLAGNVLMRIAGSLPVTATAKYWEEFQQAAGLMRLAEAGGCAGRAAARPAGRRPPG